jgi:hypothetical protein
MSHINTPTHGCMDSTASNYNPSATVDSGDCTYVGLWQWVRDSDDGGDGDKGEHPTTSRAQFGAPTTERRSRARFDDDNGDASEENAGAPSSDTGMTWVIWGSVGGALLLAVLGTLYANGYFGKIRVRSLRRKRTK